MTSTLKTQTLLRTKALRLNIKDRVLINALDWEVNRGECWSILGRNGAGKSSLVRSIANLREVDAGEIFLQEKKLQHWSLADLAKQRAYLPQNRSDAFSYRAIETVLSARHPYQDTHYWETNEDREMALSALKQLDVEDLAERDVRSLSGGERQRVAIAALIAQDTDLMLLDEPVSALDLTHQVSVMQLLSHACREQNKAIIMVGHDLNLAYRVATHALLMMPDGAYMSGVKEDVMSAHNISLCLGHTIERFQHGEQTLFVPI